jgi:hypothetical protein
MRDGNRYHFSLFTYSCYEAQFQRGGIETFVGRALSAPLAICLAALRAVGWTEEAPDAP